MREFVMRGLDPRIHHLRKSLSKGMDCRVKPGNDACHLDTCAETASHRPFCFAQQSV
jgi:hypothetical protein